MEKVDRVQIVHGKIRGPSSVGVLASLLHARTLLARIGCGHGVGYCTVANMYTKLPVMVHVL